MSKNRKILIDQLIHALSEFKDPVTLQPFCGRYAPQINIRGENLYIIITMKNDSDKNYQFLQQEIEKVAKTLIEKYDDKLSVSIIMTSNRSLPFKTAIAVASGKGGVGKSTTAIGLAYALSDQGLKVGVLDADIYGPSLPILLGQQNKPHVNEKNLMIPIERDGIQFISMGFLLQNDAPIIWRGPMASQAIQQFLHGVAWAQLDILIIDLPPGTGDIQLTLIQKASLFGAIIVSTPQPMALIDARKAIEMFNKVRIPILGIVENMSTFVCPHCQEHSHIFDHAGTQKLAQELNLILLGEIPLDLDIRRICDEGNPRKLLSSIKGKPYQLLAQQLCNQFNLLDHLPKSA
jgi:ATP-binding protein involved in chromosome partitioning